MQFYKYISLYILSGLLLGVGFMWPVFWIVGLLGVVLQLALLHSQKKWRILGSFVAWTVKYCFVNSFYWSAAPIEWLPVELAGSEYALIALHWGLVSLFLGTGGIVLGILYNLVSSASTYSRWFFYIGIPFIWVIAEISSALLFSVFTLGPGSEPNIFFSLGYVGLLLAEHNGFLQLARLGGVYVLSFVAVLLSLVLLKLLLKKQTVQAVYAGIILVLVYVTGFSTVYFVQVQTDTTTEVVVVDTSFPVSELFNRESIPTLRENQSAALDAAFAIDPDHILLPEDGRFLTGTGTDAAFAMDFLQFKYSDFDGTILDSSRTTYDGEVVLQSTLFDFELDTQTFVHKRYLVPEGEFIPYLSTILFGALGFGDVINGLSEFINYRVGPLTSQAALESHQPGILFCFESAAGTGVQALVSERPDAPFIAHIVAHSWFNDPYSLWNQLDSALKVQALWNNISIVSASSHAESALYLPNGQIQALQPVAAGEYWKVSVVDVPIK